MTEKPSDLPAYAHLVKKMAQKGADTMDQALNKLSQAAERKNAAQLSAAIDQYGALITRRTPIDRAERIVTEAWEYLAHRASAEDRGKLLMSAKDQLRLRLKFDEKAPLHLAEGREAYQAGNHANAARSLAAAMAAGAPYEQADHLNLIRSLLAIGNTSKAGEHLLKLDLSLQARPEVRELMAQAELIAPKFRPTILTYAFIGESGDQNFSTVDFDRRGVITVSSGDGKFAARFDADGRRFLGVRGDTKGTYEQKRLQYAVRKTMKNPWDSTEWKVGYKQVAKLLQQPYLYSPHDWQWWGWSNSDASKRSLMADSRANYLAFPTPEHFITMAWGDGGNTTISRHPQNLDKKETIGRGPVINACKLFLGEQKTGKLLNVFNCGDRASAIHMDTFGNTYVSAKPAAGFNASKSGNGNRHVLVFNPDLTPKHHFQFNIGSVLGIGVRENIMVVVGRSANEIAQQTKTINSPKPQWKKGDGDDAVVIIVKLW